MAMGVVIDVEPATDDQYDALYSAMGFSAGGRGAAGLLFHWSTLTKKGMRLTEVWQSREAYDRFVVERLGPATARMGIAGPPAPGGRVTFHEVHSFLTAG